MSGDEILINIPTTTTLMTTVKPKKVDRTVPAVVAGIGVVLCGLLALLCVKNKPMSISRRSTSGSATVSYQSSASE